MMSRMEEQEIIVIPRMIMAKKGKKDVSSVSRVMIHFFNLLSLLYAK